MVKSKTKVLITGGAGFIGSHLTNALIADGFKVLVVDDLSKGKEENINKKARFVKTDVRSKHFFEVVKDVKPDYIFHLAAQSSLSKSVVNPKKDLKINLLAVVDILNAAKTAKVKKVIFASSAAVYGQVKILPIKEEVAKSPSSPYGIAKLASEFFIQHFYQYHNLPYTILRYANVYGQNQDTTAEGGVVGIFINKILKGQPVYIYGDGKQTRDFIHVSDVVAANIAILKSDQIGEFNVGTGIKTSINNLFTIVAGISGNKHFKKYGPTRLMEVKHNVLSAEKIQKATGWKPRVGMESGLKITFEHFKSKMR